MKLPDGIGDQDHLAFGLCYPTPGRILFRDRDGKETTLDRAELFAILESGARILAQDEALKSPRAKPGQLSQEVIERVQTAARSAA